MGILKAFWMNFGFLCDIIKRAYLRDMDLTLANSVDFNFPICDMRGIGLENL